jgi:hypothetical protein
MIPESVRKQQLIPAVSLTNFHFIYPIVFKKPHPPQIENAAQKHK